MEDTLSNFNKYKNDRKEWIRNKIKHKSKIESRVALQLGSYVSDNESAGDEDEIKGISSIV